MELFELSALDSLQSKLGSVGTLGKWHFLVLKGAHSLDVVASSSPRIISERRDT